MGCPAPGSHRRGPPPHRGATAGPRPHRGRVYSASVDLLEVVALVAEALFLCVGVVVAALCPAPLLGLLLGRLRPPPPLAALPPRVTLRAQVRAARRLVAAAAPPALSPRLRLRLGLLGLLGGSGLGRPLSLSLLKKKERERTIVTGCLRLPLKSN